MGLPTLFRNHLQMKYFLDCELFGSYHSYIRCKMLYDGRNAMTDKELVQKVHNGNQEALGDIIERYYEDIFRFCLYMVR